MSHRTFSGWSTVANLSYGGVATRGRFVFVTDMMTGSGKDRLRGIIRFDTASGDYLRFAGDRDVRQVTLGLDGLLYALGPFDRTIGVYDPATLQLVREFVLPLVAGDVRGAAVNAKGDIFTNSFDGVIRRFSPDGVLLDSLATGFVQTQDIDIFPDGRIVAAKAFEGRVFLTDESLDTIQTFVVPGFQYSFVSWIPEPVPLFGLLLLISVAGSPRVAPYGVLNCVRAAGA